MNIKNTYQFQLLNNSYIHGVKSNTLPLDWSFIGIPDIIHIQRDQIGLNCAKEEQICMP